MRRALKVCSCIGCPAHPSSCPALVAGGRCDDCRRDADARRRRTPEQRAYKSTAHAAFRAAVLQRDPVCVLCRVRSSVHADHHPVSRRDLVAAGLDPNDPAHGRGVCKSCHSAETAQHQPGGWHDRHSS